MANKLPTGFKEMEDAEVWVNVVIEEGQDKFGRLVKRTTWQRLDKPVNLGSLKKPKNEEIIGFKVVNKTQNPFDLRNYFGGFFK